MVSWLQITSGRGPEEYCWVVGKLWQHIITEAKLKGINTKMIDMITGINPKTFNSVLIALKGKDFRLKNK